MNSRLASIAPALAAGGRTPNGHVWWFESPVDDDRCSAASTCWVVPVLPDGRTAAVLMSSGRLHIPGGTLEPGETWRIGAARELREELGARILDIRVLGALVTDERVRLVATATITDPLGPQEPDRAVNHVVEIRVGPPDEVVDALIVDDKPALADMYRLTFSRP